MSEDSDKVMKESDEVLYFAYGSNMSELRLKARVASTRKVTTAKMRGFQLCFHKHSLVDGSAKCDAFYTGNQQHVVWGVVFSLAKTEIERLDKIEGQGYDRVWFEVETQCGELLTVVSYRANCIDRSLFPYEWYKHHVLQGAIENDFSTDYIAAIEAVTAQTDPDQERAIKELAIYLSGG